MKYGSDFVINRHGIWIMFNGRMYSFFRGMNTKKWQFSIWDNIWRKEGKSC